MENYNKQFNNFIDSKGVVISRKGTGRYKPAIVATPF
jgi:hypothetical protein